MIIFSDFTNGDELISDSFNLVEKHGCIFEADCAMITIDAVNVDTGANASAEGGDDEGADDVAQKVNNIIHSFRLQSTSFDKKGYLLYLKGFLKAVKAYLLEKGKSEAEVKEFEAAAQKFVKEYVIPNFKDLEFYTGESMNPDGSVVLLNYREDGVTPFVMIWKHGCKETKV